MIIRHGFAIYFTLKMSDTNNADILSKVIEYLSKKGYAKTEATLRAESANQDVEGKPVTSRTEERGGVNYRLGFGGCVQGLCFLC